MMKKPMAKKAMPAKKGAAKMAAKPAMPMMKNGGMAKKYMGGGSISHEMSHGSSSKGPVKTGISSPVVKNTMRKGGKAMMRKGGKSC